MDLGRVGVWSGQFRRSDPGAARDAASELDELGFGTLWIPGGVGGDILDVVGGAVAASETLVVATGILNVWMHDAMWVASRHAQLTQAYPDRFLLGLGVSHAVLVDNAEDGHRYARPLSAMIDYLDLLDTAAPPVPTSERALAALGPKMLELARDRALGAHPYLVTTDHTAHAREILGPGPLLAPELKVVLSTDATEARSISRQGLALYLTLPNYTDNLQRIGFTAADLANGGSDPLVDSIVAWGDLDAIAHRIRQHREAGADHVCLQVLTANDSAFPLAQWRELASMLPAIS